MIRIKRWQIALNAVICLLSIYFAAPTLIPQKYSDALDQYLPSSAKINLGLDLRGGASLLLEVDLPVYYKELLQGYADLLRDELKKISVGADNILVDNEKRTISLQIHEIGAAGNTEAVNDSDPKRFLGDVQKLTHSIMGDVAIDFVNDEKNAILISLTPQLMKEVQSTLLEQSIEIVRRRVDENGTKEIDIQKQGDDRILLQIPGVYDTEEIPKLLGKTAKLSFNFASVNAASSESTKLLQFMASDRVQRSKLLRVESRPVVLGEMLVDARATVHNGMHVVQFKLTTFGAKVFAEATAKNIGKPLAIILDNQIVSAPVIQEAIPGGSGLISGNFTAESANELALLLRSGALPTPLKIIEERVVGPSLGEDSVYEGTNAIFAASIAVMVFMILFYSFWGIFANIALVMNGVMIIAVLGLMNITLTLPGLAGIALTLGMAVDANVLICERMREEYSKHGKRLMEAINSGYRIAFITIFDSNITTIAAAIILYFFGNGPIKGFALSLTVGILCSLFTSISLTKMFASFWYKVFRVKTLGL